MPGGDRSGPRGQGAMTGRGLGSCAVKAGNIDLSYDTEQMSGPPRQQMSPGICDGSGKRIRQGTGGRHGQNRVGFRRW